MGKKQLDCPPLYIINEFNYIIFAGAQPVGVSREHSSRREGARQLQLPAEGVPREGARQLQQLSAEPPLVRESANEVARTETRKSAGRRPAPTVVKQQQQQVVQRKEQVVGASGKRGGGRPEKETVGTVERYRSEHEDGSITWGYENEDGSYKVNNF